MQERELSVLVIEDNEMYKSIALQAFDGFTKYWAETAKEGYDLFKEKSPDITMLDIGLPDKSGLDLLIELKSFDPESFIVMMTASSVSTDVSNAKKFGANGYIIKPFNKIKLMSCINEYYTHIKKLEEMDPEEKLQVYNKTMKLDTKTEEDILSSKENKKSENKLFKLSEDIKVKREDADTPEDIIKTWQILFVDTYLTNRERAGMQLAKLGCKVDIAEDGIELLKLYNKVHYDVIFLDSKMPVMDGYEVTKKIRSLEDEHHDKHTIMIGMIEDEYEMERRFWLKSGMNEYVMKPATFTQLRAMVEKYAKIELDKKNEQYVE